MPKKKGQRKAYRGPNYARDPRLAEAAAEAAPEAPRGGQLVATKITEAPSSPLGRTLPRVPTSAKWGLGAAGVGFGAGRVNHNRRKKMDVRKNADIPFKGVRTFAAPKGRTKPGQLPFTERYTFPGATPRQLGVQRFTGTSGNRTGRLVQVTKRDRGPSGHGEMSGGRAVGAYLAPGLHGAIAGRGGEGKAKTVAAQAGGLTAGALLGSGLARASGGRVGMSAMLGGLGSVGATGYAHNRGWMKSQGSKEKARKGKGRDWPGAKVEKSALPTRVRSVQPRTATGQFVGDANDLQHYTPKFKSKNRQPRTSKLQHYTRGSKDQYASGFEKSLFGGGAETSLALTGTIGMGAFGANQGRRGQRF